jgi:hypothetical protein
MKNCTTGFPNSYDILSWLELGPDGVALASGRLHISYTQFPYQGLEHPDHESCRPDGWIDACIFHIWSLSVRSMKTDVRTVELCMHDLPYEGERSDRNTHRPDGCSCLPIYVFWKEIFQPVEYWNLLDMLLRSSDGCKMEQFEGSRHRGRSRRKVLIVWTDDAWTVERSDGISRRPDGCKASNFFNLESVQNLLEA